MTAQQSLPKQRFLRKTTLQPNERNQNFVMLDDDIVEAISSIAADRVTPLMSKIYLRLKTAPAALWERAGVLRFEGEIRNEKRITAWEQLCKHLRVSSETANKALRWMHAEGIIGYSAFKNGVGIRIFLNRASASISSRPSSGSNKILSFAPASDTKRPASVSETAFKVPFGVLDDLDTDFNSDAPKNSADRKKFDKNFPRPTSPGGQAEQAIRSPETEDFIEKEFVEGAAGLHWISANEIIQRLQNVLEPSLKSAAAEAAAKAVVGESIRTREWFETKALPKAIRVAQSETYNLVRKHGANEERFRRARTELEVGRTPDEASQPHVTKTLSLEEINETAETCVALLEVQGKKIDVTLSEISMARGGWVLPADVAKVREAAEGLLLSRNERN